MEHHQDNHAMDHQNDNLARFNALSTALDHRGNRFASSLIIRPQLRNSTSNRPRRLSAGDETIPANANRSSRSVAMAVRSRDGLGWVPAPDSLSYTTSQKPELIRSPELQIHTCETNACAALHVFRTAELHELILSFLPTNDILTLRLVDKRWNDAVLNSPYLRLHLFARPRWNHNPADFQLLPFCTHGLEIKRGEPVHLGQWISLTMTLDAAQKISPQGRPALRRRSRSIFEGLRGGTGRRYTPSSHMRDVEASTFSSESFRLEDLQIAHPPIVNIHAFTHQRQGMAAPSPCDPGLIEDDTSDQTLETVPYAKVSAGRGLTLGFLADTTKSLLERRKDSHAITYRAIISFTGPKATREKRNWQHVLITE